MNDEDYAGGDSNIEWKKSGFESTERLSLKINVKKAIEHEAKDKSNVQKAYTPTPTNLPNGLSKIRKKIKEVYDDDEDEEGGVYISAAPTQDLDSSLFNALNEDEKKILRQQDAVTQSRLVNNTDKIEAFEETQKIAKEAGLKGVKKEETLKKLEEAPYKKKDVVFDVIKEDIKKETGLKMKKSMTDKEMKKLSKGIKEVRKIGGEKALEGLKPKELIESEEDERRIAEMILEKSGRDKKTKGKKAKELKLNPENRKYIEEKLLKEKQKER